MRDELEGLRLLRRRVIRNREVDVRRRPEFSSQHAAMLADVDGAATLGELLASWGRAGAESALAVVRDLLSWGACALADDGRAGAISDEIPIYQDEDSGAREHAALLAEDNDLDEPSRRRVLTAVALLGEGRVLELLGVGPGTERLELKRAYYALAKEFHPDRFYGRRLGSFGPLLSRVFEAASQAIKTLVDQRTVTQREAATTWPQRRRHPRYPFHAPLRMRCESWAEVRDVAMRQIGAGGMFVATETPAAVGELAAFEVPLPDRSRLTLRGKVVNRIDGDGQRATGLCVQFAPMPEGDRTRFASLLEAAQVGTPVPAQDEPAPDGDEAAARPLRLARGSGRHRAISPVIGIDLGTSYTSVSAAIDGRVHVLPFRDGRRALPSVVAFPRRGEIVVGAPARARLASDPRHTIASVKRLLGRAADDRDIQGMIASAGYSTLSGPGGELMLEMWGEPIAVPQICGHLLEAARIAAEEALGVPVGRAVLTAPVSFGKPRLELLQRAARLAHLEVVAIVDEPSAAAVANRFRPESRGLVGVYDFGGGTFDFSVVDTSGGDFRVVTAAGDSWLGGDDFDHAVADALANLFWRAHGVDLRQRAVEWQQLVTAVERAKRTLSRVEETELVVPEVSRTAKGTSDLTSRIRRTQVEKLWRPLIDRSLTTCLQSLAMVGLAPGDLDAIYLSGGTTHIPVVRDTLARFFGTAPVTGVPPDFAVCLGAGVQAAQIEQLRAPTLQPA